MMEYIGKEGERLNTEYLKQFALLAKEGRFQTAADKLFISQSTLSKHIASLEQELGQPLFWRSTRVVRLTEFGGAFLPYAEKIIGILHACDQELMPKYRKSPLGLKIGIAPFASIRIVMQCKFQYQEEVPEIAAMKVIEATSSDLYTGLKTGRYDMVIDGIDAIWENDLFSATQYIKDRLVAVIPSDWPSADRPSVALEELQDKPYIHLYSETDSSPLLSDPFMTADTVQKTLQAVAEGKGFALLPCERIRKHLPANVRIKEMISAPVLQFNAYTRRNAQPSAALKTMLRFIVGQHQAEGSI